MASLAPDTVLLNGWSSATVAVMRSPLPAMLAPLLATAVAAFGATSSPPSPSLWSHENVAAWCIVPYDAKHRGPEERAQMLDRLGIKKFAYDFRDEHIPTFDAEVDVMTQHGIEIVAWWFPVMLDATARTIFSVIERHHIHPELWVTGWESPATKTMTQFQRIEHEAERLRPIVTEARRLGCTVSLYNHGGWFGEPDNEIAIVERLRRDGFTNIAMVYNFHHGHDHIAKFAELWPRMQRYVTAVNVNGMIEHGDTAGRLIVPVGDGQEELGMMRIIEQSEWRGLIGVLNHQPDVDAEEALKKNLAGLDKVAAKLRSGSR